MELKLGDSAPLFSAPDQGNIIHSLSDYLGSKVLLYFYPKDDTPGCTKEACNFRDNIDLLANKAVVLGISGDSAESHAKFAQKYNLNFPLLSDSGNEVRNKYGTDGLFFAKRTSFLIDEQGKIIKIYSKVNPDSHVQEVLKDLSN